eukprot:TRINITY_DN3688_c0_g1_i1.p1 TRINITY_DN3688_c0_g1~~TRINITY_DN3688_c0_g1_i1.p1  ORF type:complete len:275 (-),score=70.24 TRINITY_DN3688_c0_g1_i1:562-1341(-)
METTSSNSSSLSCAATLSTVTTDCSSSEERSQSSASSASSSRTPPTPSEKTMRLGTPLNGGHKDSVLCMDVHSSHNLLCSGSEDGTARIWDLNTSRSVRLLQSFDKTPINSVAFGPTSDLVYFSAGRKIGCYDLRRPEVILTEKTITKQFQFNKDEINQIVINNKETYLAACDDEGETKVIDLQKGSVFSTIKGKSSSISSSVQFRDDRPKELIFGGFDTSFYQYDFAKSRMLYRFRSNPSETIPQDAINNANSKSKVN